MWKSTLYLKNERNNLDILKQWEGLLLKQKTLTSITSKAKNLNINCQIGLRNSKTLKNSAKETRRISKTYQNVRKAPAILTNGSSIPKY